MKYSEKLRDPRWQKKRLEVMNRDAFTCQHCGDKEITLNVHHKQYHGNPWDAPSESLETLCELCHKQRTDVNKNFLALSTSDAFRLFQNSDLYEMVVSIVNPKLREIPEGVRLKRKPRSVPVLTDSEDPF